MKQRLFEERLQYFLTQRLKDEGTINAMMDMKLVSADYENKTVILEFPVCAWQMKPAGSLHGGMIATALDITMGCIAYISSEAVFTPTIQMAVNFVGGVKQGDCLVVEGICDHDGSRMAQTRAVAKAKSSGKVVATANGSYVMNTKK